MVREALEGLGWGEVTPGQGTLTAGLRSPGWTLGQWGARRHLKKGERGGSR